MMKKTYSFLIALFMIGGAIGQSCLSDGIFLTSQAEINNFKSNYPGCTEIEGFVEINGSGITNLDSLHQITSIGGYLEIYSAPDLDNIEGLGALMSVGSGRLGISGTALTSLHGLESLLSVPGLRIEGNLALTTFEGLNSLTTATNGVYVIENLLLTDFNGLVNLTNVGEGGTLIINYNDNLTSLSGLANIDFNPLHQTEVWIDHNPLLSECEVNSICDLLNENAIINVNENAAGCNTIDEVRSACGTYIDELNPADQLAIHPNPAQASFTIHTSIPLGNSTKLTIYNINGQQLHSQIVSCPQTEIDAGYLLPGIYIVKVWNEKRVMVRKVIKQ